MVVQRCFLKITWKLAALAASALILLGARRGAADPPPWPSSRLTSEVPISASWRPGKGIHFSSGDERFDLHVGARVQFRHELEQAPDEEGGDLTQAFMLRRARLKLKGHLLGRHQKFKMELAFSPRDLGLKEGRLTHTPLLDWQLELDTLRDLTLRVGQFKVPFNRERLISSGDLQLVDRSIANGEFNLDRDLGISVLSKDLFGLGLLRYAVFLGAGEGRDTYAPSDLAPLIVARVELFPLGFFSDLDEADLGRTKAPRLALGVAYGWLDEAKRDRGIVGSSPADGGTTDTHHVTADLLFKWAGLSILGEFFWRQGRRHGGNAVDDEGHRVDAVAPRDGYGAVAQAGYLMPWFPLEVSGRYAFVRRRDAASGLTSANALGGGLSYYAHGHAFKVQLDYFRLWGESVFAASDRLRAQIQLAF